MSIDTHDELSAFGAPADSAAASTHALTDFVERNPVPAVLAAAAVGAGLMALVSLMTQRDPDPRAPVPLGGARGIDYDALKRQIADLADRLGKALPVDAAKQRAEEAGDAIADGWHAVRAQVHDALNGFDPRAMAVVRVARENPVLTALVVGAVGALLGSQMLSKPVEATHETP